MIRAKNRPIDTAIICACMHAVRIEIIQPTWEVGAQEAGIFRTTAPTEPRTLVAAVVGIMYYISTTIKVIPVDHQGCVGQV